MSRLITIIAVISILICLYLVYIKTTEYTEDIDLDIDNDVDPDNFNLNFNPIEGFQSSSGNNSVNSNKSPLFKGKQALRKIMNSKNNNKSRRNNSKNKNNISGGDDDAEMSNDYSSNSSSSNNKDNNTKNSKNTKNTKNNNKKSEKFENTVDYAVSKGEEMESDARYMYEFQDIIKNYWDGFNTKEFKRKPENMKEAMEKFSLYKEKFIDIFNQ